MTDDTTTLNLFFDNTDLDAPKTQNLVNDALTGMDDGELYMEFNQSEAFTFDDNRLKSASFDTTQGFGLRGVSGESTGYAHANEISQAAIKRATESVQAVRRGSSGEMSLSPVRTNKQLYTDESPIGGIEFGEKVRLLESINDFIKLSTL